MVLKPQICFEDCMYDRKVIAINERSKNAFLMSASSLYPSNEDLIRWLQNPDKISFSLSTVHGIISSIDESGCLPEKSIDETNKYLTRTFPAYVGAVMDLRNVSEQSGDKIIQFLGYSANFCVMKSLENNIQLANCVYRIFNKNEKLWKSRPELLFCLYSYSNDSEIKKKIDDSNEYTSLFADYRFNYEFLRQYFSNNSDNVSLSQHLAMLSLCTTNMFPNNSKYAIKFLEFIKGLDSKSLLKYENKYLHNAIFVLLDNQPLSFPDIFPSHVLSPFTDLCIMSEVIERQILGTTIIKKLIQLDQTNYYFKEWATGQGDVLIKYLRLQSNSDLIKALADLSGYYIENTTVIHTELTEIVKIMREAHASVKNDYLPILERMITNFYQNNSRSSIDILEMNFNQMDEVYTCFLGISSVHYPDMFEKMKALLNESLEWPQINGFITFASYSDDTCNKVISACFEALLNIESNARGNTIIKLLERICTNANSYILQNNLVGLIKLILKERWFKSPALFKLAKIIILRLGRPLTRDEITNLVQYITANHTQHGLTLLKEIVSERGLDFIEYGTLCDFLKLVLKSDTPIEYIKFYGDFTLKYMRKYETNISILSVFYHFAYEYANSNEAIDSLFEIIYLLLLFSSCIVRFQFMNEIAGNRGREPLIDIRRLKFITSLMDRYYKYDNRYNDPSLEIHPYTFVHPFKPIKNKGDINIAISIESYKTIKMLVSSTDRIIEIEEGLSNLTSRNPVKYRFYIGGIEIDELKTIEEAEIFDGVKIVARPQHNYILQSLNEWFRTQNTINIVNVSVDAQQGFSSIEVDEAIWNFIKRFDIRRGVDVFRRPLLTIRFKSEDYLNQLNNQIKREEAIRFVSSSKGSVEKDLNSFTGPKFLRLMRALNYGIDSKFVGSLISSIINPISKITKKFLTEIINTIIFALKSKQDNVENVIMNQMPFVIRTMNNEEIFLPIFEEFSDIGKAEAFKIAIDLVINNNSQLNCPKIRFLTAILSSECDFSRIFPKLLNSYKNDDKKIAVEAGNFFLKASKIKLFQKANPKYRQNILDDILQVALTRNITQLQRSAFQIVKDTFFDTKSKSINNKYKDDIIEIISRSIDKVNPTKFRVVQSPPREMSYCGLRNLGSTCYLSSVLQQLFFIRTFRHEIYKASPSECQSKPIIGELKNLFTQMAFSDKQYCDTQNLFTKLQSVFLGGISTRDQMDSFEFFDGLMMNLPKEISNFFKGVALSKITYGKESKTTREDIYHLTLPIKGFTSLEDSFESDSNPTIHQGIKGSNNKKESAMQTTTIEKLPSCMVIQLARFKYTTGSSGVVIEKNNDRFEFPMELNMNNFKVCEFSNKKYKLCGIVTHSGTPVTGHYCAVVNRNEKWFHFDDQNVKEVDSNFIESIYGNGKSNSACAYMLFYIDEKILKDDTDPIKEDKIEIIEPEIKEIKNSNSIFLKTMSLFTQEFADFVLDLNNDNLTYQYFLKIFIHSSLSSRAEAVCNSVIKSIPNIKFTISELFSRNITILSDSLGQSDPDSVPFIINVINNILNIVNSDEALKFINEVLTQLSANYKTYSLIPNQGNVISIFTKDHPDEAKTINVYSRVLDIIKNFYNEVTSDVAIQSVDMSSLLMIIQISIAKGYLKTNDFPYDIIERIDRSKHHHESIREIIPYLNINFIDSKYLSNETNITNMLKLCQSDEEIEEAIMKLRKKDKLTSLVNTKFFVEHYKGALFPILVCDDLNLRLWAEKIGESMFQGPTISDSIVTAEMLDEYRPMIILTECQADISNPDINFTNDLQTFIAKRCADIHTDGQLCQAFRILDRALILNKFDGIHLLPNILFEHLNEPMNVIELLRSFIHINKYELTESFANDIDEYLMILDQCSLEYIPSIVYLFLIIFGDILNDNPEYFQAFIESENVDLFNESIKIIIERKIDEPINLFVNLITSIDVETSYKLIKEIPQFIKIWSPATNKYYMNVIDFIDDIQFFSLLNIVIYNLDSVIMNTLLSSTVTLMMKLQDVFEVELFDDQIRMIGVTIAKYNNPMIIENLRKLLLMGFDQSETVIEIIDNIPINTKFPGVWHLRAISVRIDGSEEHKTEIAGQLMEYIGIDHLEASYVALDALLEGIEDDPPIWAYMIRELVESMGICVEGDNNANSTKSYKRLCEMLDVYM